MPTRTVKVQISPLTHFYIEIDAYTKKNSESTNQPIDSFRNLKTQTSISKHPVSTAPNSEPADLPATGSQYPVSQNPAVITDPMASAEIGQPVIRIVVIGPESTGKSTLCEELSQHFDAPWCPEFAREYLMSYGNTYSYDDLLTIAKGQLALEDEYAILAEKEWREQQGQKTRSPLLLVDTNMYVMKVWCEFVFGNCHSFIIEQIVTRPYDLYLLCNTDLPWTNDELREYPDHETRQKLYLMYKDILVNQHVPWVNISGNDEERLLAALDGIHHYLSNHTSRR